MMMKLYDAVAWVLSMLGIFLIGVAMMGALFIGTVYSLLVLAYEEFSQWRRRNQSTD